ncbi:hypothetical protein I0C86_38285 [Plantactinospora sp. S1510]|uniref:Uncharacterized protein n=1 Tax=Plantactinospora alkalitolerans TaxID=2789879 RepID=A0ABS0H9B3_9ACTN|nr:hypothetical protein [Plantactinospora alkalitolerans]MBF9134739.1 hypothetical protein [Plantactinospora alkalitolerans]
MRKLWFELRRSLQQAEEAIASHQASELKEPWLILDVRNARLWFTPANAPRPRSVAVPAAHGDGPMSAGELWPLYRQPLTEPDPDHESMLDQLRAAAGQGHRWLVADLSTPTRLYTAAAYDTDTVPQTAHWTPAWLATGDLGPYPGQTAHGYQHNGSLVARFTRPTVQRIASDANARALRSPDRDADLLVLRHSDSSMEMFVVRAPAAPTDGLAPATFVVGMRRLTADSDGWYRLTDDRWPWRQAIPPTLPPSRRRGERHQHEPDVFEPDEGPTGSRCTVCGATGYDIAYLELPSMAGAGTDTTESCRICGSSESFAQEVGWSSRRAIWPPVLTATAADREATRQ